MVRKVEPTATVSQEEEVARHSMPHHSETVVVVPVPRCCLGVSVGAANAVLGDSRVDVL